MKFQDAVQGLSELLSDPKIDDRVKQLLTREYPQGDELHRVFISHSFVVTQAALTLARRHKADLVFVEEAAWLHDIGIKYTRAPGIHCQGEEPYLRHGLIGKTLCDELGLTRHGMVCENHVGTGLTAQEIESHGLPLPRRDMLPQSKEERLICYADKFFSKSGPGCMLPLPVEEVSRRTERHGDDSLNRFVALREEFGDPFIKA